MDRQKSFMGRVVFIFTILVFLMCFSCSSYVDEQDVSGKLDLSRNNSTSTVSSTNPKSGVMLQGFNWASADRNDSSTHYKWYSTMLSKASEIKNTFEYVWFPPPSATASTEGYLPTELNNFNSYYGSESELRNVISAIAPAKAIADIVINHRCGSTDWGDFRNPQWNEDYWSICGNDEGFSGSPSMMASSNRGAYDTGESYAAARDIDHTNWDVQNGIIDWMNLKLKDLGFVGWRYDFVKGYSGYYVGKYNSATNADFSVGEYWPTNGFNPYYSQGWKDEIMNWVNSTATGGYKTRAFDFVLKGNLNNAFGYSNNTGLWDMSRLADSNNLFRCAPEYAVTFIDNHDTGSTQQHWEMDAGDLAPAYAFLLTHPGYPCVAWQHYFTGNGSQYKANDSVHGTGYNLRQHIDKLIEIRQDMGIGYDSGIEVLCASTYLYVAKITGTNGSVIVKIGGENYTPTSGYSSIYSGTNFGIWVNSPSSSTETGNSSSSTETVYRIVSTANPGYGQAVYFTGSFNEGNNWSKAIRGTYDSSLGGWYVDVTGSDFEWKYLTGSYSAGETVSSPFSGLTWASGGNMTEDNATLISNGSNSTVSNQIIVHAKYPYVWYWEGSGSGSLASMTAESGGWYKYTFNASSINLIFRPYGGNNWSGQTADLSRTTGEWWYNGSWNSSKPN